MTIKHTECERLVNIFTKELTSCIKMSSREMVRSTTKRAIANFSATTGEEDMGKCIELLFEIQFKTHALYDFSSIESPNKYMDCILSFALMLQKGRKELFFLYPVYLDLHSLMGTNGFNDTKNRLLDKAIRKLDSKKMSLTDALYEFDHNDDSVTSKLIGLFIYIKRIVTTHCPHNSFSPMLFNLPLEKISIQRNRHENNRLANALRLL